MFGYLVQFKTGRADEEVSASAQEFATRWKQQDGFKGVTFFNDGAEEYGCLVCWDTKEAADASLASLPPVEVAENDVSIRRYELFSVLPEEN